jgi:DNA-binding response OmpR family regulator
LCFFGHILGLSKTYQEHLSITLTVGVYCKLEEGQTRMDHNRGRRKHTWYERFLCRGPFTIDLQDQSTLLGDKPVLLPPCTFDYLVTLVKNSPEPVSYQTLVIAAQGQQLPRLEAQDLARAHIYMLRRAIEENHQAPQFIMAVPGFGYKLVT